MYYRRKLLLSLIKEFGGNLSRTDCQKLTFLFCQRTKRNYYDFFPYQYGGFSYVLNDDKRHLTDLGYLENKNRFSITQKSFQESLETKDIISLKELKKEIGRSRGETLIKKIYLEYPYYAINSDISNKILSDEELSQVEAKRNKNSKSILFTIGYEGISIDAYLDKLIKNNIHAIVDVRKNPISRKFGFSKNKLQDYVQNANIHYYHLPELGIKSQLRQNLNNDNSYKKLFAIYEKDILPRQIKAINKISTLLNKHKRIALTCFEIDHLSCHRHKITNHFTNQPSFKIPINHLN